MNFLFFFPPHFQNLFWGWEGGGREGEGWSGGVFCHVSLAFLQVCFTVKSLPYIIIHFKNNNKKRLKKKKKMRKKQKERTAAGTASILRTIVLEMWKKNEKKKREKEKRRKKKKENI